MKKTNSFIRWCHVVNSLHHHDLRSASSDISMYYFFAAFSADSRCSDSGGGMWQGILKLLKM